MILNLKSKWVLMTYITLFTTVFLMTFISGCGSDSSSSVNPVNLYNGEGRVTLYIKSDSASSVTYGHGAPQFFVENEIPMKYLKSVGLFVSKVNLISEEGETVALYSADQMPTEPTFYLRDDYQTQNSIFVSDVAVKAYNYVKMEIMVDRVYTVYKNSELGAEISWDNKSYSKTIILNALSPIQVTPNGSISLEAMFDISGRVGLDENNNGEFYPYAYLLKKID